MLNDEKYQLNRVSVNKYPFSLVSTKFTSAGLILFIFLFCALPVKATNVSLSPSLGIIGEYNDNILFSQDLKYSDYIGTLSPGLAIKHSTELINLNGYAAFDISRYADNSIYDDEIQSYGLKGDYRLSEKLKFKGDFSYLKDTTLDSYLEETGIVTQRQEMKSLNMASGFSYQVSDLSVMNIDYAYRKRDYESRDSVDYDLDSVNLSLNRKLKSERDYIVVTSSFTRYSSDFSEVDDYGLSAGWSHQPSENYRLDIRLGGRYTRITPYSSDVTDGSFGGTADISLNRKGETSNIMLTYRRELNYSSFGETINVDRIYTDLNRQLFRRLGTGLRCDLYRTVSESKFDDRDLKHFEINPYIFYQLTARHTLEFSYKYSWLKNETLSYTDKRTRNMVWINLKFNFPSII